MMGLIVAEVRLTIARFIEGLLESRIRSSAQAYARLRRLSIPAEYRRKDEVMPWMQMNACISTQFQGGIWRVNFEIDTLPSEEAAVMTKLQQLKNSEDFADKLKEAPQSADLFRAGCRCSRWNMFLLRTRHRPQGSPNRQGPKAIRFGIWISLLIIP